MAGGGISEDGDIGFQIAPMVDVVFVLLLFFMACAGSQVIEAELNISLPSGKTSQSDAPPPNILMIDILSDGGIELNRKQYDTPDNKELPELKAWLKETIKKYGDKDPVIIRPDPNTKHERVMDVLNAASASGVKKLSFD